MNISTKIRYRIAYYGDDKTLGWYAEKEMFIPLGMRLYVTTWDNLEDAMQEMRRVKKLASGWWDRIFIDSFSVIA